MTDDGEYKTYNRRQRVVDTGQMTNDQGQRTEDGRLRQGCRPR